MTSDFDYKKYSLKKLEEWVHDAVSCSEASPQEIYDTIKSAVEENYYVYKNHTSHCYELLALLNGNGKGHIQGWDEWEETYYPEESPKSCDRDDPSEACKKSWTSFWEDRDDGMRPWRNSNLKYKGSTVSSVKQDKVTKWVLPVEPDPSGEYFVTFPDDLLEATNLKEGDQVEWVDQGDGSYLLKKVDKTPSWVEGNKLAKVKTHDEMIADGWEMTDDGFWVKED